MTSGTGMQENNKGRENKRGRDTESESYDKSYVEYVCHRPSQFRCSRCPLLPELVVAATARHRPATSNRAQCRLLVPCALCAASRRQQSFPSSAQPVEMMSTTNASTCILCRSTEVPSTLGERRKASTCAVIARWSLCKMVLNALNGGTSNTNAAEGQTSATAACTNA